MSLFRRKSLAELMPQDEGEGGLKRALTATNLILLGIGAIIGAGIFVLTGTAAAQYAGPAIVLSFVLAGSGCLFAGLCYAEFASMIPVAGSAYTYGYATLGELVAWIIGWDLILEYLFAASTVAVGWSGYFTAFMTDLGIKLPPALTGAPFAVQGTHTLVRSQICVDPASGALAVDAVSRTPITLADCVTKGFSVTPGILNVPAMVLIALLTALLVVGIKESARFNNIVVYVKMAIVLAVIIFGFKYINTANWTPFIPPNTGEFGKFGWSGILRGAGVIFFAYIGFDAVSTAAPGSEESAEGPADRHPGLARHLHGAVHPDGTRDDGHRALYRAQRATPGVRGHRQGGPGAQVAHLLHQHRRHRRPRIGGARDAHGPAAHLLQHVA
jgi:APA family basic amino acid/polyamine antiporter